MSATDDGGNARRGLSGWLDRLRGPLAAGGDAVADSAQGEGAAESALLDAVVSGLPDPETAEVVVTKLRSAGFCEAIIYE